MNCWDRIEPPALPPLRRRLLHWWRRRVLLRVAAEVAGVLAAVWLLGLVRMEGMP